MNKLAYNPLNLIWVDCEMTGLNERRDVILEIACVVTSPDMKTVVEGPAIAIHHSQATIDAMDTWNKGTHGDNRLIDRCQASRTNTAQAEKMILDFVHKYVPAGKSPLCGNVVGKDRDFLELSMPHLLTYMRYKDMDLNTLIELGLRLRPVATQRLQQQRKHAHGAMQDIKETISMMRAMLNILAS
jgi:oligoribonuclease